MNAPSIHLRPLEPADVQAINAWPAYEGELAPLDYALRPGGWLDMFPPSERTRQLAVIDDDALVGFTLLTGINANDAEFYIAIHPRSTGRGTGRQAAERTLEVAFGQLHLERVTLKVRTWHKRGIALYGDLGFKPIGEKDEDVLGRPVHFLLMAIERPA